MSNIHEHMTTINALLETSSIELKKLEEKQIKTSGAKIRANLLTIKKLCDTMRKEVLEKVKAIPTKNRRTTTPPNTPEQVEEKKEENKQEETEVEKPKPKKRGRKPKQKN